MDQVQALHNQLVNAKASLAVEKERFEAKQIEFEEMRQKLAIMEESKSSDLGISIAGAKSGSLAGAANMPVQLATEMNYPPTQVDKQVRAHDNGAACVVFRPQANKLVTAGNQGYVRLWTPNLDVNEKKEVRLSNGPVSCVSFNQAGSIIAAGDCNSQINLIRLKPGMEVLSKLQGHQDIVNTCVFSSEESRKMISVSQDRTTRIWDINTQKQLKNSSSFSSCWALDI